MDWTPEKIQQMYSLKAQGYSAAEIGLKLGCTRNCVIGKLHRLAKQGIGTTVPAVRTPYLSELSWGSWSTPRYREG